MRKRMRTIYIATNGQSEWRGDCARWAAEAARSGCTVTTVRTLWLGPAWPCTACALDLHYA